MVSLGGYSGFRKILLHSQNYAALAEYRPENEEISVTVQPLDQNYVLDLAFSDDASARFLETFLVLMLSIVLPFCFFLFVGSSVLSEAAIRWLQFGPLILSTLICFSESLFRYQQWHAAEHMAIAAFEKTGRSDLEAIRVSSRINIDCGTCEWAASFLTAIIFCLASWLLDFRPGISAFINWGAFIAAVWLSPILRYAVPVNRFGCFIQRLITTRQPEEIHLQTAKAALDALIEADPDLSPSKAH